MYIAGHLGYSSLYYISAHHCQAVSVLQAHALTCHTCCHQAVVACSTTVLVYSASEVSSLCKATCTVSCVSSYHSVVPQNCIAATVLALKPSNCLLWCSRALGHRHSCLRVGPHRPPQAAAPQPHRRHPSSRRCAVQRDRHRGAAV